MRESLPPESLEDYQFAAYLSGELPPVERAAFDAWVADNAGRAARFAEARAAWDVGGRPLVVTDVSAAWSRVQVASRAGMSLPARPDNGKDGFRFQPMATTPRTWWPPRIGTIAGSAFVAVLCLIAGRQLWRRPIAGILPSQRFSATAGHRTIVRFADGSTIMLAPATSITVMGREVELAGQAYFTIAAHSAQPLMVRTSNAIIRVLGTRFNVRDYAEEGRSAVTVEEGRVTLQPRDARVGHTPRVLGAQMVGVVTDSNLTISSGVHTDASTEWTDGTLVFDKIALVDVVTELARSYGSDIQITDSTLAKHVVEMHVSIADVSLEQVLDALCKITDAHLSHRGQSYVLSPGRAAARPPAVPSRRLSIQPEQRYGR